MQTLGTETVHEATNCGVWQRRRVSEPQSGPSPGAAFLDRAAPGLLPMLTVQFSWSLALSLRRGFNKATNLIETAYPVGGVR